MKRLIYLFLATTLLLACNNSKKEKLVETEQQIRENEIIEIEQPSDPDEEEIIIKTIQVGDQVWMLKNLDVSTFRNGDPIPEVKSAKEWITAGKNGSPAWCYYNNNPEYSEKYGKLYNWFAVSDPRQLAPEGWHIATNEEWKTLGESLGGVDIAGGKLKSDEEWQETDTGNEKSGFNAYPGGFRSEFTGEDDFKGQFGMWWSSSDSESIAVEIISNSNTLDIVNKIKTIGMSVRCIKD